MKRYMFTLALMLAMPFMAVAQSSNTNRLMVGAGALYERGLDITLSVEHETRYHNAWEYFGNYYIKYDKDSVVGHVTKESFWDNYNTWSLGFCYKPCVSRGRNHHGYIRFGGSCGSDLHEYIGGVHLGYEHSYALRGGWELYFQVKEDFMINCEDVFRTGIVLGFKIPLNR